MTREAVHGTGHASDAPRSPPRAPSLAALPTWLRALPWPLPALLAWATGWLVAWVCLRAALPAGIALVAGTLAAGLLALLNDRIWRRAIAAAGFPVSQGLLLGLGAVVDASAWLLALLPLLALYPLRAWRDAPFFPTPATALAGLDEVIRPAPARVLDVGCGVGHGLQALARLWPAASLHGVEWSAPMAWLARRRVPRADIARGDMWARSWAGHDLVYVFQRPETMARAWAKARAELSEGAWFASLEFPVPGETPQAVVDAGVGRPVHVYRVRCVAATGPAARSTGAPPGR